MQVTLLGWSAMCSVRYVPTFSRNFPPSQGQETGSVGIVHDVLGENMARWLLHSHSHRLSTYLSTRAVFSEDVDN